MSRLDDRPPRVAEWLLTLALKRDLREAMMGDLEQCYRDMIATGCTQREAGRWYWREAMNAPRTWVAPSLHRNRAMQLAHAPIDIGSATHIPISKRPGDNLMTVLWSDIRFAWRMLSRRAGSSSLAVATLALGIGATTAIFSVVNPILVESLPYPKADELVMVWERDASGNNSNVGYTTFDDLQRNNRSFESMAAMGGWSATITTHDEPRRMTGQRVSPSFFHVLGVAPALGRDFRDDDNVRGTPRVVIISNGTWRSVFGGDSAIIGKQLTMDGEPYSVVGVMPAGYENVLGPSAQMWTPLRYNTTLEWACRDCRHLRAVARLKSTVSQAQATKEIEQFSRNLLRDFPTSYATGSSMRVPRVSDDLTNGVKPALLAVLGAVLLVLLVACLNVSNLLLARSALRRSEFALRSALGAARGRIVRQLLTESVLLASIGGLAGVGVAFVGVKGLIALGPDQLPRLSAVQVDGNVLAFALLLTTVVGIAFGLIPAWRASRAELHNDIRQGSRTTVGSTRMTRATLVITEVALALVLLVGSGLLWRSMSHLLAVNPGFETQGLVAVQVSSGAGKIRNDTLVRAFFEDALRAVRQRPGVISAAYTSQLPLSGDFDSYGVRIQSQPDVNPANQPDAFRYAVSDQYFETMKIPLASGRLFTEYDKEGQPLVVILNAAFVSKHFKSQNPIGQRVQIGGPATPWREVVGVVGDVRQVSLSADQADAIYLPESQWISADYGMSFVVRSTQDVEILAPAMRTAIWSVDKDQPIVRIATAESLIASTAAQRRFAMILFQSFGVIALVLAAAGIYGVLTGSVTERMRELGVRSALGATGGELVQIVLKQGMMLTGVGMALGLGLAALSARVLNTLLFGVQGIDPLTYAAVAALLGVVALIACWVPAYRASRVDPMEVLRAD